MNVAAYLCCFNAPFVTKYRCLLALWVCLPGALFAQNGNTTPSNDALADFYAWWMMFTGLFFGGIFYIIWRVWKRETQLVAEKMDGVRWFAWALGMWGISGCIDLLMSSMQMKMGTIIFKSIFSTANSVFILFVLPSIEIDSDNQFLNRVITSCKHKLSIIILAFVSLVLTIGILIALITRVPDFNAYIADNSKALPKPGYLLYLPDILFSLATILVLMLVLSAAFKDKKRGVESLLWVVYLTLFVTVIAEISPLFPFFGLFSEWACSLSLYLSATLFKMLLITLFSILLYSYEKKKAEEQRLEGLLPLEVIKKRWNLEEREIKVLQLLANGKTRDEIGEDETLFPKQRASARKNVDDLLGKIPDKFRLPANNRTQQMILLFALQHKIIHFEHLADDHTAGNVSGNLSGNVSSEK